MRGELEGFGDGAEKDDSFPVLEGVLSTKGDLVGFGAAADDLEEEQGKKGKQKSKKAGGGFQAMGLSLPILKGVLRRGYRVPTPIQRKTIPVVLEGRDVVAMARTGSGKTACFLIPLFEKLLNSVAKQGARALILSPTRELALQTLKFIKELGKFTSLKATVILGGDSMDNQFAAVHGNPDIIVATPGRFLHVCVEMDLKLQSIQYVVFDEADRLFEMGFGEQLEEIVHRLPEARQTVLFSATLPKVLVDFAKAGLSEPVLIRLDVENKIPEKLSLIFLTCRADEKTAGLLSLLKYIIPIQSQVLVFAATRHHVEYLHMILEKAGISNTYIYSNLDPSARKINAAKFGLGKVRVLLVTDVAARGLDIPKLDCVINYNFPAKSKLFVHRVGRCARAGRSGTAYSLVGCDELPYLLDLHLFLGRPLHLGEAGSAIGTIPADLLEEEQGDLLSWHTGSPDLISMKKVCDNAYRKYLASREGASHESVRRVKELNFNAVKLHPIFGDKCKSSEEGINSLRKQLKTFRPRGTVFEIGASTKCAAYTVMKQAKKKHEAAITHHRSKVDEVEENEVNKSPGSLLPTSNADDIRSTFHDVIMPKKCNIDALYRTKKRLKTNVDNDHFIPYQPADRHTEQGLSVNSFQSEASKYQMDLTADTDEAMKLQKQLMKWDAKKKRMVGTNQDPKSRKIRTESGVWIKASFKSKRYDQWKERNKVEQNEASEDEEDDDKISNKTKAFLNKKFPNTHWGRHNEKLQKKVKSELKRPEQILKIREIKESRRQKSMKRDKRKKKRHND